jgi:hypothetical protein
MAGDWIPMRLDLAEDPAVMFMAEKLECREEVIVGYLHKIWSWASRQCHDGSVTNVTLLSLGRVTNLTGFPEVMRDAGWIVESKSESGAPVLIFPKWENWLGQSAKKRIQDAKRQAKSRESSKKELPKHSHADVTKKSRSERDESVTTGEESTVQDSTLKEREPTLSEHMKSEEFQRVWMQWRLKLETNNHRKLDQITEQQQLFSLSGCSTPEAIQVVRYSTSRTKCNNLIFNFDRSSLPPPPKPPKQPERKFEPTSPGARAAKAQIEREKQESAKNAS